MMAAAEGKTMMVFCRYCDKELHESAPTCPHCGGVQNKNDIAIPDGIKGWSWGAFLLNWIWAIGNRTWIGLLALVPLAGIIMAFILGFKGREWAWRNKHWESVEHFKQVQKKWSFWGIALVTCVILINAVLAIPIYQDFVKRAKQAELQQYSYEALPTESSQTEPNGAPPTELPQTKPHHKDDDLAAFTQGMLCGYRTPENEDAEYAKCIEQATKTFEEIKRNTNTQGQTP